MAQQIFDDPGFRYKNVDWRIDHYRGGTIDIQNAQLAVLIDLRDQLQEVNERLAKISIQLSARKKRK